MSALSSEMQASILIVDDTPDNLRLLSQMLTEQGYKVRPSPNGRLAFASARNSPPNLILLDINMPEMDGYEVCRKLKEDKITQDIPIIFISALNDVFDKVKAFQLGAVDYISKPFQLEEVLVRVQTHLSLQTLQAKLQHQNQVLSEQAQKLANTNAEIQAFSEWQRKLFQSFATKEVVDELMAYGFSPGGHCVQATALFADIRSFTHIAEQQTPESTIELLNDYFGYMIDAIGSELGIVNQIVGDGLMAIFGAPIARSDHAQRAVRAAVKMMTQVDVFNQQQIQIERIPIKIGIGIASGDVIAGYLGTQMRATYTCVGDTVNVAARLEAYTKEVGHSILIDQDTEQALTDEFSVFPQGVVYLKGKTQPVQVFSVGK